MATSTFFGWAASADPDGDPLTYRIEFATGADFANVVLFQEGLTQRALQPEGLLDGQTLHWRVLAVDAFGATSAGNPSRTVTLDNNSNPTLPGAIAGFVSNAITGAAIGGASVTISGFANPFLTGVNGEFYVLDVTAGTYTVTASADGHQSRTRNNVAVFEGSFQDVSLPLTPDDAPFRWGEVSGDGIVGTIDASLILQWVVGLIDALPIEPGTVYPAYPEAADVTGDAVLGTLDASAILQWKVRLIPTFAADTDGDDFGPEAIKREAAKILPQTDTPARVRLVSTMRADGALVLGVSVEDAKDLSGYALSISYDVSALTLAGVARAPHGWIGPAYYEDNGVVYVTSAGSEPVYEKAILTELVFLPNPSATALSDAARSIRIEAVLLNDGQHPVLIEHAESADEEAQND